MKRKAWTLASSLLAGMLLVTSLAGPAMASSNYTVQTGDTLWRIAATNGVSVSSLMQANNMSTTSIYPGQTLTIPSQGKTYRVVSGDTMWKIASKLGVSLNSLTQANPQVNPNYLYVGQVLNVPSSVTAPQPSPQPAPQLSYVQQVAQLVNAERAKAGLQPLRMDGALSTMAADKAKDMIQNNYFSHTSPTYGSPFDMMKQYGIAYSYAGENIAEGQQSPQEVMQGWMNSSGHRANILNSNYDTIGVGYYQGAWVQEFIGN
ncbi:LysM peptidoglycan-binding domain-containing protein [Heliobacterium chlorum]|nr:LysM peptidoglycan-binding domain-containing protein [Heliobacterium chlorum]